MNQLYMNHMDIEKTWIPARESECLVNMNNDIESEITSYTSISSISEVAACR